MRAADEKIVEQKLVELPLMRAADEKIVEQKLVQLPLMRAADDAPAWNSCRPLLLLPAAQQQCDNAMRRRQQLKSKAEG